MASDNSTGTQFKYPSYVQHIMGDIFSLGFGPFRYIYVVDTSSYMYMWLNGVTSENSQVMRSHEACS